MKGSNRVKLGSCDLVKTTIFEFKLFPLFQNVNAVGYRIKLSREYQPVGRMEGHFGQQFQSVRH